MSLGNSVLANFTPKASRTAASLLTSAPKQEHKKEMKINLRLTDDVYQLFKEECESHGITMSAALRSYIESVIAGGSL